MFKKIAIAAMIAVFFAGCTVTTRPSIGTMAILNERISKIEEKLENPHVPSGYSIIERPKGRNMNYPRTKDPWVS